MQDHFDIAVIGAGAAGLAAAQTLRAAGLEVVVLEARARIGGRAWTVHPTPDLPLDLGCGWLHSADRNPLARLIEARGFAIDRTPPHWERQAMDLNFSAVDQAAFGVAFAAFEQRLETAAEAGVDAPTATWLAPGERWNPLIDAISTYYSGAELDQVSLLDYAAYQDSEVNWRVREGYGAGLAAVADDVVDLVATDCPVEAVDHGVSPLRLTTPRGTLSARAVIVTVSTPLLAEAAIRFTPALPDKAEAAAGLPLGLANKVFLKLDRPEAFPEEGHLFGRTDRTETGGYLLRPFGRGYVEAFLGGRHAQGLEAEGPGGGAAFVLEELGDLLGADARRGLTPLIETAWRRDPWARGSYSHALPGCVGARAELARPVEGRLFWAGEATHPTAYSTAHGAWESGLRAAVEAMAALA